LSNKTYRDKFSFYPDAVSKKEFKRQFVSNYGLAKLLTTLPL